MNFTHLVGNTPMIRIRYRLDGQEQSVWAKLEAYNLSGSIKDRLAAHVIAKSTANGTLKPGQPIVEMTSGNTGIAFAGLGQRGAEKADGHVRGRAASGFPQGGRLQCRLAGRERHGGGDRRVPTPSV